MYVGAGVCARVFIICSSIDLSALPPQLHEDLNRILKKPYVPNPDSMGRPAEVVAQEYLRNYRLRNDSVIADLFTGQLRSTLGFPCGYASVTYDAYNCLSLPLPETRNQFVEVTVVFAEPARFPVRYSIPAGSGYAGAGAMGAANTVRQVKNILAGLCGRFCLFCAKRFSASRMGRCPRIVLHMHL